MMSYFCSPGGRGCLLSPAGVPYIWSGVESHCSYHCLPLPSQRHFPILSDLCLSEHWSHQGKWSCGCMESRVECNISLSPGSACRVDSYAEITVPSQLDFSFKWSVVWHVFIPSRSFSRFLISSLIVAKPRPYMLCSFSALPLPEEGMPCSYVSQMSFTSATGLLERRNINSILAKFTSNKGSSPFLSLTTFSVHQSIYIPCSKKKLLLSLFLTV